ncbi:ParA family protein [Cupriavidus basilensis]|uniref:ParA family protein n=1 Tax=Cupriavidus basilensis TaxID=68895 RepID=A0A643FT06_9BURK|nr:ParA family protein [Cupriavidus basilensis]QOT82261.1 ParA family protein [Cupriavidus basilensis]
MAKLITVINNKGGVGKTTIACHLAFASGEAGKRTLLCDFDTQGNAGQFLTKDLQITKRRGGSEQLFEQAELQYTPAWVDNIQLLHGHGYLQELDSRGDELSELAIQKRGEIRKLPFDYVIFDTPPALGPRQTAPLFWSDLAVVIVEPQLTSLTGMADVFKNIQDARKRNPSLQVQVVINRYTKASSSQKKVRAELEQKFGKMIVGEFTTRVAVSDALANYQPVWRFAKDKKLNAAWKDFSGRVLGL